MMLKDRYLIEKELGRGGIGMVYLARDTQLHSKLVVIKVLLDITDPGENSSWVRKKFRQEIEALARLNHPHIVGVSDAGETPDGQLFIVMEFVKGMTLRSVMSVGSLALGRVARIVRQLGQALSAAHESGIFHRDLKPENVMLQDLGDGEELTKLIDFGIATVKDSQIAANADVTEAIGTPPYMAPEQLMGKPAASSDIYALGVIAYEMITGRLPFSAGLPTQRYKMQQAGVQVKPMELRPDLPAAAQEAVLKALAFDPQDRYPRARDFGEELARALAGSADAAYFAAAVKSESHVSGRAEKAEVRRTIQADIVSASSAKRVTLLYKHDAQPDEQVLKLLETQLAAQGCQVFLDRHLAIGVEWAREIERQVRHSDVVIPLLSAASVSSEMLAYEVQIAQEAAQQQLGKPRLLAVRVNYDGPLPEPLVSLLNSVPCVSWHSAQDDSHLMAQVLNGLGTAPLPQPSTQPKKLEPVGGAVPLDSEFYIVRPADEEFRAAIARQDSIVLVKGARQMGKTSLLARGLQQARAAGAKVVLTDFQKLNATHLASIDALLLTLAELITDQLDLDLVPEQSWNSRRGASMNFERYIRREVLSQIAAPLVWGLDEVDRLFTCDFGSEVFGLFRSWHNERSLDPAGPWQRITLAIAYATEAHLFITDLNQSPFNVGTRLTLEDFSFEQVAELNRRYGSPLSDAAEVARFFRLVSGHPYLVRRGLHEMASYRLPLATFEAQADRDEGPFSDHLRRILVLLAQDTALCEVVRGVLQGRPCPTAESFYRLRAAGLMAGDSARSVRPRCQLYATYLERHLL